MIDYSKYKRVFAFGCSFTNWYYPTWADIIAKCCTNSEFYNFGVGGAGNLVISSRITQANLRFNFCETDLILVLFSTPYREDRWIKGDWKLFGNIYNQPFYDEKFVHEYTDPVGLILRDLTIVETAMSYVENLPCDNIMLRAVEMHSHEFTLSDDEKPYYDKLSFLYNNSKVSKLPLPLNEPGKFIVRQKEYSRDDGSKFLDQHPWPTDYLTFLIKCNIPVTQEAKQYAIDATRIIENTTHWEDYNTHFSCISSINDKYEIF